MICSLQMMQIDTLLCFLTSGHSDVRDKNFKYSFSVTLIDLDDILSTLSCTQKLLFKVIYDSLVHPFCRDSVQSDAITDFLLLFYNKSVK